MKKWCSIAAGLLIFVIVESSLAETQEPRVQRLNLVVSDMDRALQLYRDVLGFQLYRLVAHKEGSYAYELFQIDKKAQLREAMLSSPTQQRVLGLTEVRGVPLPPASAPSSQALVMQVKDLSKVIAEVQKLGLKVFSLDTLRTVDDRVIQEQGFIDWNGHLILVYSYVDG